MSEVACVPRDQVAEGSYHARYRALLLFLSYRLNILEGVSLSLPKMQHFPEFECVAGQTGAKQD